MFFFFLQRKKFVLFCRKKAQNEGTEHNKYNLVMRNLQQAAPQIHSKSEEEDKKRQQKSSYDSCRHDIIHNCVYIYSIHLACRGRAQVAVLFIFIHNGIDRTFFLVCFIFFRSTSRTTALRFSSNFCVLLFLKINGIFISSLTCATAVDKGACVCIYDFKLPALQYRKTFTY